jgi:hypothetical protein
MEPRCCGASLWGIDYPDSATAQASKEELNEEKMQALALEHMTPV